MRKAGGRTSSEKGEEQGGLHESDLCPTLVGLYMLRVLQRDPK